jgi:hypothetical protein
MSYSKIQIEAIDEQITKLLLIVSKMQDKIFDLENQIAVVKRNSKCRCNPNEQ